MGVVSKPCQDRFLHPILVHSISENKENTGSQMGHTKKNNFKKVVPSFVIFDRYTLPLNFKASRIFRPRIAREHCRAKYP